MGDGWEYIGRLFLADGDLQFTSPRGCRGPVALVAASVPAVNRGYALTIRVSTRTLDDSSWVVQGMISSISVPSDSTLLVEGLQDEYRFELEHVGLPALGDPMYVDLYENWRLHGLG